MTITILQKQKRAAINQRHNVIDRMTWGLRAPKKSQLVPDWGYNSIVLHHSGNAGEKDPKEIETLHMVKNGWDDVGYHYMVHPDGVIYEGRKIYHKGSHVSGANTGKIGILLLGDYNEQWWDFDDILSKSHVAATNSLIKTLKGTFLGVRKLGGHKEFLPGKNYTCPGNLIMGVLGKMRKKHGLSQP